MSKAQLGELFAYGRKVGVQPLTSYRKLNLSEHALRRLAPAVAALFLILLGTGLTLHLSAAKQAALERTSASLALAADVAAVGLEPGTSQQANGIETAVAKHLLRPGWRYLLIDADDTIADTLPAMPDRARAALTTQLTGQLPAGGSGPVRATNNVRLPKGRRALAVTRPIGKSGERVAVIADVHTALARWRDSLIGTLIAFASVVAVLSVFAFALYRLSRREAASARTLAVATERLGRALERGRCGLWDWDVARGHLFWSGSMYDMLGLPRREELLSFGELSALLHPEDRNIYRDVEMLLSSGTRSFDKEMRMRHADGSWIWLRARGELSHDEDGDTPRLVGVAIDINEQKRADRRSQEADSRLRDAIENLSEAFVLWDHRNRLVMCNSKFQEFHNLSNDLVRAGTPFEEIAAARAKPLVKTRINENTDDPESVGSYEVQLEEGLWLHINERRTKDGGFVSVGTDITPLKTHEERLVDSERELMATVQDLETSRAKLERQAQQLVELADKYAMEKTRAVEANRSKSDFLANMSHELRTPLNAIIGFSEIMQEQVFGEIGSEKYLEYAHDIQTSGQYLLDVINDILDMSKIEAGRISLDDGQCDIGEIIDECLRIITPRADEQNVTVKCTLRQPAHTMADKRALKQVLLNLLSNAIKFTPAGGEIVIDTRSEADAVTVAVADSGIGIRAEDIEKLARPFEQVENQFTKSRGGSGLGLAISRSLIELHGGHLKIESEVNKGTTVSFTIPNYGDVTPPAEEMPERATA